MLVYREECSIIAIASASAGASAVAKRGSITGCISKVEGSVEERVKDSEGKEYTGLGAVFKGEARAEGEVVLTRRISAFSIA